MNELDHRDALMLYDAITRLEAQEVLVDMMLSGYAYGSKDQRSKLHREMYKKAYPTTETISLDELERQLKNGR